MERTIHLPRLGATVTIGTTEPAARSVRLAEIHATRSTQGELLQILEALSASNAQTATMLRAAVAMARRVDARLATMEG